MNAKERIIDLRKTNEVQSLKTENAALKKELAVTLDRLERMHGKSFKIGPVRPYKRSKGDQVRAFCCDLHGAKMHKEAAAAFIADMKTLQPDTIILGGDMVDVGGFLALHHVMGYVAEIQYSYDDDIAAANRFLDDLMAACPTSQIKYVEGNHECLTPDHDVLTDKGWLPIAKVTTDHTVACMDDSGFTQWVKPRAVHSYDYDGELVCHDSKTHRIRMTPEHRVWHWKQRKLSCTKAKQMLGSRSHYQVPVSAQALRGDYAITDTQLRLLAKKAKKKKSELPDLVRRLSQRQAEVLVNCLLDDTFSVYGPIGYLESIQAFAVVHGYACSIESGSWDGYEGMTIIKLDRAQIQSRSLYLEHYSGKVHCLTTDCDNFFFRHRGVVGVTGNSRVEKWAVTQTLRHNRDADGLRRRNAPEFLLQLAKRGIKYYRMSECYDGLSIQGTIRLGKCYFTHGSFARSKNAARDVVSKFSGNVVFGNTHRADIYIGRRPNVGTIGGYNPGCLCELQPVWCNTDPTDWSHGYAIQFVAANEDFLHINIPIIEGRSLMLPFLNRIQ